MSNGKRPKSGGRQKGTPNKRSAYAVQTRLEEIGFDLVGEILKEIKLMEDPIDKAQCYLRLLEYCDAKRKAIEVTGQSSNEGQAEVVIIKIPDNNRTPSETN